MGNSSISLFLLMSISYVFILTLDNLTTLNCGNIKEGFVTESSAAVSKYEWLGNEDLFDDFLCLCIYKVNTE